MAMTIPAPPSSPSAMMVPSPCSATARFSPTPTATDQPCWRSCSSCELLLPHGRIDAGGDAIAELAKLFEFLGSELVDDQFPDCANVRWRSGDELPVAGAGEDGDRVP